MAMIPTRPSPRLRFALLGLVFCAISYTIIWDDQFTSFTLFNPAGLRSRRQLAYLDAGKSTPLKYGRDLIDQNYQALLPPSGIDSSIFRKRAQAAGIAGSKGYDETNACDDVFLFMPYSFAHNGHGSQLNNYLLAAMIASFTNRAMVMLEPPPLLNVFKGNSQFGCPPEAWETKMVRAGGVPKKVGWNKDFPSGLDRLVKHPAWLSRQCSVPCQDTYGYEEWEEFRLANNATQVPTPNTVRCITNGRPSNVLVMGGRQVRDYFETHYKAKMLDRSQAPSLPAAEWALRLNAAPHEARIFASLTNRHELWDYASAFMARSGILRFQPWIARDVEEVIKHIDLPLDVPYDSIHVRRGDKLESDARRFVIRYWNDLDQYDKETEVTPRAYIPFSHYLSQFEDVECKDEPRLVYVASDDPVEVKREASELPKDSDGNTLMADGTSCHKFRFVFGPADSEEVFHIDGGKSKGSCEDRYERNLASIADLMILTKSDIFVGEFNSNWGRLVRTFRLKMNDSSKIMNGARPVLERPMVVAWGNQRPGPPGW